MAESTQHKLDRVRPPRVQITYDVEIGNAIVMKELPYVVGIIADLSGQPENPLPKLKFRKFVEVDRDNFNDLMASIAPRVTYRVSNKLANDGSMLSILLIFKSMDDFNPVKILQQVEPLAKLFDARTKLANLLTKLDGNDPLSSMLLDLIESPEHLNQVKALLSASAPPSTTT